MIKQTVGDLLCADANIICHQVNCKGVMGAGVAKQIKEKLLSDHQFELYRAVCNKYSSNALGQVLYSQIAVEKFVANLFAEDVPTGKGLDTDYEALKKCFETIEFHAWIRGYTVAVPGRIGCGLAGGDWEYVLHDIIEPIFKDSSVLLTVVYYEE